jgi:hypothetical protein
MAVSLRRLCREPAKGARGRGASWEKPPAADARRLRSDPPSHEFGHGRSFCNEGVQRSKRLARADVHTSPTGLLK